MQGLKELILLYQQHRVHPLKYLAAEGTGKSKLLLLYEGIASGKFKIDETAAKGLYGERSEGSKYRKLKADLREKLLAGVLHLSSSQTDYTDYQKAYYDCHRDWVTIRHLTGQGANTSALRLANRLLREADKYNFVLLCMDVSSYLRIQYGLRESNDKKFIEANVLFEKYQRIYDWECKAEELYTTLIVRYANNKSANPEVVRLSKEYYQLLLPALEQYPTYKLKMYGLLIGLMALTTNSDYRKALHFCDQAIQFFTDLQYEARVPLQIFYYQKLVISVHLREFQAGEAAIEYCVKLMQEGSFNWFKYRELHLHLSLHTKQYDRAADLLEDTLNHPKFGFLPENAKEFWRIVEAYVTYLSMHNLMRAPRHLTTKISKIIPETPISSRDKSGVNIAIIVLKILVLLQEKRFGQLLDEAEAIDQYCYRHLRGSDTRRSYAFVKMLLQLPLCGFDQKQVQVKSDQYIKELNANLFQLANQTHEIEIVPYEDLWQLALDSTISNYDSQAA